MRHLIERVHDWAGCKLAWLAGTDTHPQERDDEAELRRFIAEDAAHKRREDI
jgi:hypothetical protein